jgi:hypothetical protein
MPVDSFLAVVSAAAAVAGVAIAFIVRRRAVVEARAAARRVREGQADKAIATLDLKSLGDYVYGTLGDVPIVEYADNPTTRANVAQALDQIEQSGSATGRPCLRARSLARRGTRGAYPGEHVAGARAIAALHRD